MNCQARTSIARDGAEIDGDGRRGPGGGDGRSAAQRRAAEALGIDARGVGLASDIECTRTEGERRGGEDVAADVDGAGDEVQQERALADRRPAGIGVFSVECEVAGAGLDEGDGSATGVLD